MADGVCSCAKYDAAVVLARSRVIECEIQRWIARNECKVRMIQEVVGREAEFEFSVLGGPKGETLLHRQVAVPKTGPGQGRENIIALLAQALRTAKSRRR